MRSLTYTFIYAFILSLLTGCASRQINNVSFNIKPNSFYTERAGSSQKTRSLSNQTLTLETAISRVLNDNTEIKQNRLAIKKLHGERVQAALWENPELEIELENFGKSKLSLGLGQVFHLSGKKLYQAAAFRASEKQAVLNHEYSKLLKIQEVCLLFISALAEQKRQEYLEGMLKTAEDIYLFSQKQYQSGAGNLADIIRAENTFNMLQMEMVHAGRNIHSAYLGIALLWNQNEIDFERLDGSLSIPECIPQPAAYFSALSNNYLVVNELLEYMKVKYELKSVKQEIIPDLNTFFGFERDNESGENSFVLGSSISIPSFNLNQGSIKGLKADKEIADLSLQHSKVLSKYLLLSLFTSFKNTHEELQILEDKIIPRTIKALIESQRLYKAGRISSLEVKDTQSELFDARMDYMEKLVQFYEIRYELELLTGENLF